MCCSSDADGGGSAAIQPQPAKARFVRAGKEERGARERGIPKKWKGREGYLNGGIMYIYRELHMYTYIGNYIYVHVYTYTYMYIYIYIYIHLYREKGILEQWGGNEKDEERW
jgi:hypothetical protein